MAHHVTDVPSAAWSWILGHLPAPDPVELHVLCPVFGMATRELHFEYCGAHWHCFRLRRWEPLFLRLRFYWCIRGFVKSLAPDVVHGWGGESGCGLLATYCTPYAVVAVQGLLRLLCANARRWRIKVMEKGTVSAWARRRMERWAYRRAHRLVVEGQAARDALAEHYGLTGKVVPHPLRREFLANRKSSERGDGVRTFLFVGQMTARKGVMDVLRAFAAIKDKSATLTIVGSGDLDGAVEEVAKEMGLSGRVVKKPKCSAKELCELMDSALAIVVPSYGDTGPTVLKEALARGLYPIVYDNTGAKCLVERYGFGDIVATGDCDALAGAMEKCCGNKVLHDDKIAVAVRHDLSRAAAWHGLMETYSSVYFEEPPQHGGAVRQRIRHFAKMLPDGSPVVISFNTGIRQNLAAVWRARRAGRRIVREINEWPLSVVWKKGMLKRWFEVHALPKFFDGAICISDVLVDFWREHGKAGAPVLKLTMTVDVGAIDAIDGKGVSFDGRYVCYAGGMTEEKDGVDTLKKAFDMVKEKRPDIGLVLLHDVPHDEAVGVMKGAACLALARPDSLQARAGFPTKLGEYLATGRPVVVTATGEIPRYVVDEESVFLARPGDVDDIARQIENALADSEKAVQVGSAGRDVAVKYFDWHVHKGELQTWMKQFT